MREGATDRWTYTLGLHDVGNGCFAYIQPDGGWGWSNAGLIVADGVSMLVDTLFDLRLTANMLESMAGVTRQAPIGTLVNTHANGDHCYGNELLADAEIIASTAAAAEMAEVPAAMMAALLHADGDVGELRAGHRSEWGSSLPRLSGIHRRAGDSLFPRRRRSVRRSPGDRHQRPGPSWFRPLGGERSRVAVNVEAVYRQLDPAHRSPGIVEQFRRMRQRESGR